jgi:aspartokinase
MTKVIITENQSIATFNNISASYENSFIYSILEQAARSEIIIDMIAQSPATSDKISFAFTFSDDDMAKLLPIINKEEKLVTCGNVKITVKSEAMINGTGFAAKVFGVLKTLDCLPLLITTGIDEISILVHESSRNDLETALKDEFA